MFHVSTLKRIAERKALEPDGIPVEVWKCVEEEGIDLLPDLMQKICEHETLPDEKDSVIVPIYQEKGNIQDCGNDRGMKV